MTLLSQCPLEQHIHILLPTREIILGKHFAGCQLTHFSMKHFSKKMSLMYQNIFISLLHYCKIIYQQLILREPPWTLGRCFSLQKEPLYGASRKSRVGIGTTLKEPVTRNRRERNRTYF